MEPIAILLLFLGLVSAGFIAWRVISTRATVAERMRELGFENNDAVTAQAISDRRLLGMRGWLFRAGLRHTFALPAFWITSLTLLLGGVAILVRLLADGTIDLAADFIRSIPGGVGNVMVPFVLATPWFIVLVLALTPTLVVRSLRRKRVQEIEQDLPLLLDLLNTLSQAGVSFDAALDRILEAQSRSRPLAVELQNFRADNLAGRSRVDSLKLLMRRIEIPIFSTFVLAVIQAEQVGAAIGDTLKVQAVEMRARRREKATAAAMAVPTLLVVPMVIGFLPGIFVVLLGPMIYEAFGAMGQTLRGVTGQ